jgi:molybdenum cofactor biosynthesis enzyme MoaA
MSYTVEFCEDKRCITVSVTGELCLNLLQQMAKDVSMLAKEHQTCCIINDLREAVLTKKAYEVVDMPKSAQQSGVRLTFKRGLIVGSRAEEFKFLETVFVNQGHIVKMFETFEEGYAWLAE